MTRFQKTTTALIAAATLAAGVTAAYAAGEADIKYRQTNYKAIGAHMGAMSAILKGEVDHKDQLSVHADAIAAIAANVETLFPAGSGPDAGETRALPEIWSDPEGFQKVVDGFKTAAANAAEVAKSGDMAAMGGAIKQLGGSCGACHKAYRGK
jgi:cytochrome c556